MRTLLTILLVTFLTPLALAQPGTVLLKDAAGTTINTYASVQLAYDAIPTPLTQAYTIAVDSGYVSRDPYEHFPIRFTAKTGAGPAHTITLRANRRDYWLTRFSVRTDSTELMVFDGASWIIIDGERATPNLEFPNGLALRGLSPSASSRAPFPAIRFVNGANHNTIRYCEISNGRHQPGKGDEHAILFDTSAATTGNDYNIIEHCLFDTENGLRSKGSPSRPNAHNIIRNNLFDQAYVNALTVEEGTGALAFRNNEVYSSYFFTSSNLNTAVNLVKVTGFSDTLQITGNTLRLLRQFDGSSVDSALNAILIAPSAATPAGSLCIIANNYITSAAGYFMDHNTVVGPYPNDATTGPFTAIELHTSGLPVDLLIAHNTVRVGSAAAPGITGKLYSAVLRQLGSNTGGRIRALNNIFDNLRQGGGPGTRHLVLDLQDTTGMTLDYNIYHTAGTLAAVGANIYQNFGGYRAALTAQDVHSSDSATIFEGVGTYLLSATMSGQSFMAGMLLPEVPVDKNLNQRIFPYRGADEPIATCDTGLNYSAIYALHSEACAGKQIYLQYAENSYFAPVLPAGGLIHQWQSRVAGATSFSDIPGATTTDLVITQSQLTVYRVKDSCISSGLVTYTNSVPVPMKTATLVLDSITLVTNGTQQVIRFEVHTTGTATSYTWVFSDGRTDFSSTNFIDHYFMNPGVYTVTVYTDEECSDPVSLTFDTRVPQAINNPKLNSNLQVYPNPANNLLQIESAGPIGVLTITDLPGRTVLSQTVTSKTMAVYVTDLPAGIYLLRTGNGQVARFAVQH